VSKTPKVFVIAIKLKKEPRKPVVVLFLAVRGGRYGYDIEYSLVKNRKSAYRFQDHTVAQIVSSWFRENYWRENYEIREIQEMKIPNRGGQHDDHD
jgi:hypothetical protein